MSAAALEPPALRAWPAREIVALDGWVLRFSDGFTHRGNSVATFAFSGSSVDSAIDRVEREYRARNLAPMFQVADHVVPSALADALVARGYEMISPTFVRATTPERALENLPKAGEVSLSTKADGDFARLVLAGSRSEGDGRERLDILSRIAVPIVCVTALERGNAIACGTGTNVGGKVGINRMRTDSAHRRQGHAQRVLSALAQWATAQRAKILYLGVEMANAPAIALYARAGFAPCYAYRYYRKGSHA